MKFRLTEIYPLFMTGLIIFVFSFSNVRIGGVLKVPVHGIQKYLILLFFVFIFWGFFKKMLLEYLTDEELRSLLPSVNIFPLYLFYIWCFFGVKITQYFFDKNKLSFLFFVISAFSLFIWGVYELNRFMSDLWEEQQKKEQAEEQTPRKPKK